MKDTLFDKSLLFKQIFLFISDLSHSQPVSISLVYVYHTWYINIMILHYFSIFGQLTMSCPGARGDQHCLAPAQWWTNESSLWFLSSQTRLRTYCDGRKLQHSGEYNRLLLKMLYTFVLSIYLVIISLAIRPLYFYIIRVESTCSMFTFKKLILGRNR